MDNSSHTPRGQKLAILGAIFLAFWVAVFCNRTPDNPLPRAVPQLPELMGKLGSQRSVARQWVVTIKEDARKGALAAQDMQAGEKQYKQAKGAFDGWLDQALVVSDFGSSEDTA